MQAAEDSPNGTGYNAEGFNQALSDAFSAVIYDYNNNYTGGGEEEEEEMPCASLMTFGYFMQAMDDFLDDIDGWRNGVITLQDELNLSDNEAAQLLEEGGEWLNNLIIELAEGEAEEPLSTTVIICPAMFNFNYINDENVILSAGISNLQIQLNVNGVNTTFQLANLYFESDDLNNCPESLSQKAADAVNQSIVSTTNRIQNGNLPQMLDEDGVPIPVALLDLIRLTIWLKIGKNFRAEVNQCAPHQGGFYNKVTLPATGTVFELTNFANAVFTDFITDFDTICN